MNFKTMSDRITLIQSIFNPQRALMKAISENRVSLVRILIPKVKKSAPWDFIDPESNLSPLMSSIQQDHLGIANILIDNYSSIHTTDRFHESAIHFAARNLNPDILPIVKKLVGLDIKFDEDTVDLARRFKNDGTANYLESILKTKRAKQREYHLKNQITEFFDRFRYEKVLTDEERRARLNKLRQQGIDRTRRLRESSVIPVIGDLF